MELVLKKFFLASIFLGLILFLITFLFFQNILSFFIAPLLMIFLKDVNVIFEMFKLLLPVVTQFIIIFVFGYFLAKMDYQIFKDSIFKVSLISTITQLTLLFFVDIFFNNLLHLFELIGLTSGRFEFYFRYKDFIIIFSEYLLLFVSFLSATYLFLYLGQKLYFYFKKGSL